jgi:hypothetical protein
MPTNDLELLDVPPDTGVTFCEPWHFEHATRDDLAFCPACRIFHHADYTCQHAILARYASLSVTGPAADDSPREWCEACEDHHDSIEDDCPRALIDCGDCDSEHERDEDCPREFCADCDDYHDRDRWGNIECPGWYCGDCDDYHEYGEDCPQSSYDGCCDAPQQQFTVRNDGQPPLASDTRAPVALPAGVISDEGLREIRRYLHRMASVGDDADALRNVSYEIEDALGSEWQTKTGNYTKRLSRFAYQKHQVKITPEVLSQVGCIARDHSMAVSFDIDVTRDLNRPPGDFCHEDSCWWESYSSSRCALKTNGGFGLRSFGSYGDVSGRVWVMPLRNTGDGGLVPTFDTMTPDAFVVFNGYGNLAGYTGARIMAAMAGWTYAKIGFECDPMYINAGGYLIAPEEIAQTCKSLNLDVRQHAHLSEMELASAA